MEINVREEQKIVDIWLARGEDNERLRDVYDTYRGYTVVVFRSGDRDLTEETSALLRYNRRRTAEREVEQNRGISMGM